MSAPDNSLPDSMPVMRDLKDFDPRSGNALERLVFNHRLWVVLLCAVLTVILGFQATKLEINASRSEERRVGKECRL